MRPSTAHPSKSAVMGLVAAALGVRRDQEVELSKLTEGYGMAVRVDRFGKPVKDYHTIQVRPGENNFATRREELGMGPGRNWKPSFPTATIGRIPCSPSPFG